MSDCQIEHELRTCLHCGKKMWRWYCNQRVHAHCLRDWRRSYQREYQRRIRREMKQESERMINVDA